MINLKGISTWLFSKVAMLVFLVTVFSIMAGFINIVNERTFADAAEAFTIQIKDGLQGVISTGSLSAQKVIPIPKMLPGEVQTTQRFFVVDIVERGLDSSIYTAVSWDVSSDPPSKYASSSLLYYPEDIKFKGLTIDSDTTLRFKSEDYRFLVISKQKQGVTTEVCLKACKEYSAGEFIECTPGC